MRLTTVLLALGLLLSSGSPATATDATRLAGDLLAVLLPATGYGATFLNGDREGRRQQEMSLAATATLTYGTKALVEHDGPNGKPHSFPSGHAALAFSGAGNLQRRHGWRYGLPAFLAASFVGFSRVKSDEHHWEDVAAGAVIGMGCAWYLVLPGEQRLTLTAPLENGAAGLVWSGRW